MGCRLSAATANVILKDIPDGELSSYVEEYASLGLSESDILQLYGVFRKIDAENEGSVVLDRICDFFSIEKNTFTTIVFTSFDVDLYQLDEVDFPRFLQAMWNYCALDEKILSHCIFSMFDKDQDTYLNKKTVVKIVSDIYGSDFCTCEEAKLMQKRVMELRRRQFDVEYFEKLSVEYPPFLYPAFVLQKLLRERVIGPRFWKSLANSRYNKFPKERLDADSKYVPVRVLLMHRTDKKAVKRYIDNREEISAMKIATLRSMSSLKLNRETCRLSSSGMSDADGTSDYSSVPGDLIGSGKIREYLEKDMEYKCDDGNISPPCDGGIALTPIKESRSSINRALREGQEGGAGGKYVATDDATVTPNRSGDNIEEDGDDSTPLPEPRQNEKSPTSIMSKLTSISDSAHGMWTNSRKLFFATPGVTKVKSRQIAVVPKEAE